MQIALALFGLVYLSTADVDRAVRVYASSSPLAGAPSPIRIVAYERHTGRPLTGLPTRAEIEQEDGSTAVVLRGVGAREDALHGSARLDGPATLRVEVMLRPGDLRVLRQPMHPTVGRDMLGEERLWHGRSGRRVAGTVVGTADDPGVHWDDPAPARPEEGAGEEATAAHCPWQVVPAVVAGPPARFVSNRVLLYFATGTGEPRSGISVHLEPLDGLGASAVRRATDALGLIEFQRRPDDVERWRVRWDCDGTPAERTLRIVPSWAGIGLDAGSPLIPDGGRPGLDVEHQRSWGHWHLSLHCGGAWVFADALAVRSGRSTAHPAPGAVGVEADGLRFCRLGASASPHRPDERGMWLLWHDGEQPLAATVDAVLERFAVLAARTGVPIAGALRDAVRAAPSDAQTRFIGFLLALPPPPDLRLPVLVDDQGDAVEAFERARDSQASRLVALIALSLLLLIGGIAAFGWPALQARRRALAQVMEEEDPAASAATLVDSRRAGLALAFAIAAVVCFGVAMATLFGIMR